MIGFKEVSKSYKDDLLFKVKELKLEPGTYLILGANGSGKSTFVEMLSGNIDFQGTIDLGGISPRQISYVNQNMQLFEKLKVKANLNMLLQPEQIQQLEQLATEINFKQVIERNKKVSKLSGGERQKLQLLIGLVRNSEVLILDEFDNNLDKDSIDLIVRKLRAIQNKYVFIISHNKQLIEPVADYILRIASKQISVEIVNQLRSKESQIDEKAIANNKSKLSKMDLKQFQTYNKINYGVVVISTLIGLFLIVSILMQVSINVLQMSTVETTPFTDGISIVTAPRYTIQYQHQGDESWLETIPYGFSQEQLNSLANLEYVEQSKPIENPYVHGNKSSILYENEYVDFSESTQMTPIDISTLNYEQLSVETHAEVTPANNLPLGFNQLQSPSYVFETTPMSVQGFAANSLVYGNIPTDETNQIAIDIYMAALIAKERNIDIEQLVGQDITINLDIKNIENYQTIGTGDYTFQISGVYYSLKPSSIVYAYHKDSINTEMGTCYKPKQESAIDDCKYSFASNPRSQDISYMEDLPDADLESFGVAKSVYVKTSVEDEKQLAQTLSSIDSHIEVDNNYTRTHNEVSREFYRFILINISYLIAVVLGLIIISIINYKLIKRSMIRSVKQLLDHYHFEQLQFKRVLKSQKKYIVRLIIYCQLIFVILFWIRTKFILSSFLLLIIVVFIVLAGIIKLVLKLIK